MKERAVELFKGTQTSICLGLEEEDGKSKFQSDSWERPDSSGSHGGGGLTRVISEGDIFEKGGVNFSEVHGNLPAEMSKRLVGIDTEAPFYATGVSLVLHPSSPMVPTVHANFRYLEVADKSWFGGGLDLTPYYLFEEDARHFHSVLKKSCDSFDESYYPKFKKRCDEYFYLPHRGEARGIGGLFFDYLGKDKPEELDEYFSFVSEIASSFLPAYLPIVKKRREEPWGQAEKDFQLLRRGRYVEFNLIFDLGTQFGLKTGGRTESILMSLPAEVRWQYNAQVDENSREYDIIRVVKEPKEWV
jgi:coproporphyrinogen III oxidase